MSVKNIYNDPQKKFDVPNDPMYVPLQVGAEGKKPLGYVRDNTGGKYFRVKLLVTAN